MISMACSTLPHLLLAPSLRGKTTAGSVRLRSTGASGHCTKCRLESSRWSKSSSRKQRKLNRVRGVADEEGTSSSTEKSSATPVDTEQDNSTSAGTNASQPVGNRKAAARAEIDRGRNTAIITGAISVLLGVGYLVLLQLLDTRGIELIPPPPEAFDP